MLKTEISELDVIYKGSKINLKTVINIQEEFFPFILGTEELAIIVGCK